MNNKFNKHFLKFILSISVPLVVPSISYGSQKSDSLVTVLKNAREDTNMVNTLLSLYNEIQFSNPEEALELSKKGLALSEKITYFSGKITFERMLGLSLFYKGEYVASREHNKKSLDLCKETGDKIGMAKAILNLASIEHYQGRLDKALELDQQSLKILEDAGEKQVRAKALNNIGVLHRALENYDKALEYFFKSLALKQELGDQQSIGNTYDNIAGVYDEQKKYDKAKEFLEKALMIREKISDKRGLADSYINIGINYFHRNKNEDALNFLLKGINLSEEVQNKKATGEACQYIGQLYINKNDFKKAVFYYEKGLELGKQIGSKEIMRDNYKNIALAYTGMKNFEKAYQAVSDYSDIKDSLLTDEKNKALVEMETKYDTEKKEKEITLLNKDKQINEANVKRQKQQKNFLIAAVIMFLILSLMSFNRFYIKKKANKQLELANNELSGALHNLRTTQTQLIQQEKMASLGQLTAGIAHEIQNPLNFVNNFSEVSNELADELVQNISEDERKEIVSALKKNLEKINHHGKRADSIVKNMLEHSRAGTGEKQLTDINQLCEEFLQLSYHGMRANYPDFNCTFEKVIDPSFPKLNIVSQDISRVILNLFNNAFYAVREKAGEQIAVDENYNPNVTFVISSVNNIISIRIKDNGKGIPKKIRTKIFEPFFTTKPTGKGTGLGLSLSYDIIKAHGGNIRVEGEEGKGAEFIISLPVS
ncbi:MAG: tetratricopeptide repeat protein [Bacteroidia bacterium]